jgi:hypothetical protein
MFSFPLFLRGGEVLLVLRRLLIQAYYTEFENAVEHQIAK